MENPIATIWQYEIYADGVVYDTQDARDIPQYIFNIRDVLLSEAWYRADYVEYAKAFQAD
jgi:hypothetical protein